MMASRETWKIDDIFARPDMEVEVVIETTLRTSRFMVRE